MLCFCVGSTDVAFKQSITVGCLYKLLAWARVVQQSLKSGPTQPHDVAESNTPSRPTDLTGIVHSVIRHIDMYGAGTSSVSPRQLKAQLPSFSSLNRSVTRTLSSSNLNCCLAADCVYISPDVTQHVCRSSAERKRDSRSQPNQREQEQSLDTTRRKARRSNATVREAEQTVDTARRKSRRCDGTVREAEQSVDRERRRTRRQNADVGAEEQSQNTARKRALHNPRTVGDMITAFHDVISTGPVFTCTSCDQLLYRHSVQKLSSLHSINQSILSSVTLNKTSSDGVQYICITCSKYLRKNQVPPCSIANGLHFPDIPSHLPTLNLAEWRMLSPRLAFMRIHESAVGRQLRIHGNVVCVPADVCTTVNMLPRTTSDLETVAIQLKRRSQYQHALLTSNVRPGCIREVGQYLAQTPLFQQEKITFSDIVLQSLQTDENITVSDTVNPDLSARGADNTDLSAQRAENTDVLSTQRVDNADLSAQRADNTDNPSLSANTADDVDTWTEVDDAQVERAGVFDTMFTSADFVEDSERSAVYGHINAGLSDKVYSFAPAEGNRPISIFLDRYSEELAFPNIFWGTARPDTHPVKVNYSDIVKSELRRSDRRVATCIDNIFFKLKKIQMQAITSKVNIAVRKHKTGGHVYTAGQLKGTDSIDKLIKFDDGYRVLKDVRGSPPYWEKAKRDLYAMIRQLGPAQLFITLSAAETRWLHLLKLLSQIVDNTVLTAEQVEQLSW